MNEGVSRNCSKQATYEHKVKISDKADIWNIFPEKKTQKNTNEHKKQIGDKQ